MEKLKVGVLGLGRGKSHLKGFLALENAEVIGACDRFPKLRELGEEIAEGRNVKIVPEFDELLEMRPDAVVVATNGKLQVEHACQAMEAGCHVLSEVPGAYSFEEFVRLRNVVQQTGRFYMLAENSCFLDFLRYWRKWLTEGRIGPVSIAEAEYLHYLPYTLVAPDGSRLAPSEARAQGRTDLVDLWRADQPPIQYLTHDLGPLLEVLDDRCVSVVCLEAPWRGPETPLRSDGQIALYHTAKGALIKILITLNTPQPGAHRYRLMGVQGTAEWFSYEGFCRLIEWVLREPETWQRVDIGTAPPDVDASTGHGGTDVAIARHFTESLLDGKPPPIDVYRAIEYTLPGILAARSAELGGQSIAIPDMRLEPFEGTRFWDYVGLPDKDPESRPFETAP